MQITDMTDAEQVRHFKIQDDLTESRVMDERTAKEYARVCCERARAYTAHLQTMALPAYLHVWAAEMTAKHQKSLVKVHHNYLPWIQALLVVRYGEAVEHWPATVTEQDIERAREWKRGANVPKAVSI